MKVNMRKTGDNTLRLECVATEKEVGHALDMASWAFAEANGVQPQPGKTVGQCCQEQLGIKNLDSLVEKDAVELLPPFALDEKEIIPAWPPKPIIDGALKRGDSFRFVINVTTKPEYELSSYDPITVDVPPFHFDESLVDAQLNQMVQGFPQFEAAEPKPLEMGDNCLIALKCFENGEELKNLTTESRSYKLGVGYMPPTFDEGLIGLQPGDEKEFTFKAPSVDGEGKPTETEVQAQVKVLEIQKPVVPEPTDEWVAMNFPMYSSLQALKDDMTLTMSMQARREYDQQIEGMAIAEAAKRFNGKISDEMYERTREAIIQNLQQEVMQQGMSWEQFMQQNGGEQQMGMMLMLQTREMLVQGFTLDAIYRHEKLKIGENDLLRACNTMNPGADPRQTLARFKDSGRMFALRETAQRMKAAQWLVSTGTINPLGNPAAAVVSPTAQEVAEALKESDISLN